MESEKQPSGFEETDARILLIEAEPEARRLIAQLLSQFPISLSIVTVGSAGEATGFLETALAEGGALPGVVLLDYDLPEMGAARFLTHLRRHDLLKTLPVVALIHGENLEHVRRAYDFGANAVVSRSDSAAAMIEIVETLVTFWFETANRYLID